MDKEDIGINAIVFGWIFIVIVFFIVTSLNG